MPPKQKRNSKKAIIIDSQDEGEEMNIEDAVEYYIDKMEQLQKVANSMPTPMSATINNHAVQIQDDLEAYRQAAIGGDKSSVQMIDIILAIDHGFPDVAFSYFDAIARLNACEKLLADSQKELGELKAALDKFRQRKHVTFQQVAVTPTQQVDQDASASAASAAAAPPDNQRRIRQRLTNDNPEIEGDVIPVPNNRSKSKKQLPDNEPPTPVQTQQPTYSPTDEEVLAIDQLQFGRPGDIVVGNPHMSKIVAGMKAKRQTKKQKEEAAAEAARQEAIMAQRGRMADTYNALTKPAQAETQREKLLREFPKLIWPFLKVPQEYYEQMWDGFPDWTLDLAVTFMKTFDPANTYGNWTYVYQSILRCAVLTLMQHPIANELVQLLQDMWMMYTFHNVKSGGVPNPNAFPDPRTLAVEQDDEDKEIMRNLPQLQMHDMQTGPSGFIEIMRKYEIALKQSWTAEDYGALYATWPEPYSRWAAFSSFAKEHPEFLEGIKAGVHPNIIKYNAKAAPPAKTAAMAAVSHTPKPDQPKSAKAAALAAAAART